MRDCRVGDAESESSAREVPLSGETARALAELRLASPWSADDDTLRHSYASRLLLSGTDVPRVARLLGHADGGALVLKVYAHVLPADLPSGEETDDALGL